MSFVDKRNVLGGLSAISGISIELGCGSAKRDAAAIGIDAIDFPGVDIVGDVFEVLAALPNASVSGVFSAHFFEHVDDLARLLKEIARTMKSGAVAEIIVPHFSSPYFYSDPTHRQYFGLYTMSYFVRDALFARKVPGYVRNKDFELANVRLEFRSPFRIRNLVRRLVGRIINLSPWCREFYEENLCYLFPCYEVAYTLRRV